MRSTWRQSCFGHALLTFTLRKLTNLPLLEIAKLRQDTPACEQVLHFNNAGSALCPRAVNEAVIQYQRREQEIGGYEAAAEAAAAQQLFYSAIARLLNCQANEIAYVENATRAWELALYSIPFKAGDEIITFESEYASNYLGLLQLARQKNLTLRVAPFTDRGQVDLDQLEASINEKTRAIALTHIASQRGDIQPAAEVGTIARKHGLFFLLDACQSAGQVDLDCTQLGCDFLTGTGRKYLRGPRGTGFLYVNESRLEELDPVFVDLHSGQWQSRESFSWAAGARRFETFERHIAGMIGLGVATNYANKLGIAAIEERVKLLADLLRQQLSRLDHIKVHERSEQCSGIVTFSSTAEDSVSIKQRLYTHAVNVSVSQHSNARLDLDREGIESVVRASIHYYNSEAEIARFIELLRNGEAYWK